MLRELQTKTGKVYDATNKANVAMVVGMGVVKDYTDGGVEFPAAATDVGVFFVTKEKVAKGIYAGLGEFSDYDAMFMTIGANELVKLVSPEKAERYATDQITATGLTKGNYLALGTDGKFAKSTDATRFVYGGTKTVDTHTLHVIEVIA